MSRLTLCVLLATLLLCGGAQPVNLRIQAAEAPDLVAGPNAEPNGLRLAAGPNEEPHGLRLAIGPNADPNGLLPSRYPSELRLAIGPNADPNGLRLT